MVMSNYVPRPRLSMHAISLNHFSLTVKSVAPLMVSHSFTTTKSRKRIRALPLRRPKVVLSKEARAALTANRRDKSHCFKIALDGAWNVLDETMKTIASSHHKSFRRVQNELCMGRGHMRYQQSKLNIWNAFCWKKRRENKENSNSLSLFIGTQLTTH
jgi:hypothetical protein